MIKKSLWNHACNKVAVSLILVVSMFVPFIIAPSVQAAEPISVSEAISNNTGTATVQGYIVGTANSGTSYDQEAPFTVATNIGLADSPNETNPSNI